MQEKKLVMTAVAGAPSPDIYEAVVALSRSIAGRTDLPKSAFGRGRIGSPDCQV